MLQEQKATYTGSKAGFLVFLNKAHKTAFINALHQTISPWGDILGRGEKARQDNIAWPEQPVICTGLVRLTLNLGKNLLFPLDFSYHGCPQFKEDGRRKNPDIGRGDCLNSSCFCNNPKQGFQCNTGILIAKCTHWHSVKVSDNFWQITTMNTPAFQEKIFIMKGKVIHGT